MIKIGVSTFLWTSPFSTSDIHLIKKAQDMGFDVLEIPVETSVEVDYLKVKHAYLDANLGCSISTVMSEMRDLSHEDTVRQNEAINYITRCIEIASFLGSKIVGGPLFSAVGRQWYLTPEQRKIDLERCAKNLRIVAKRAEENGVTLALEPLNRFESSFITTTSQAIELMKMVDSPNLKVMMDTFHANIEETDICEAIELAGKDLVHIHANENDRGTPGNGHVPWNDMAVSFKKIQYNGCLIIETFSTMVKEIARAAAIWRKLAPSPDILARDGLSFLRKVYN